MESQQTDAVSYPESLRVAWLLIWRGMLINFLIGFVIGFVVGFLLSIIGLSELSAMFSFVGGLLGGLFIGAPLVIRMMFRKRFSGFRVRLVRESQQATPDGLSANVTSAGAL